MNPSRVYTPEMKTWEADDLKISGLNLLGYCRFVKAIHPLDRHIHENCLEFICLLKGEDTYCIGDRRYPMHGGDIFVSLPGQEHFSGEPHQGIGEYVWFQINPFTDGDFLELSDRNSLMLKDILLHWNTHLFTVSSEVMLHAKKLYCAFNEKRDTLYCIGQFISFLSLIVNCRNTAGGIDHRIQTSIDYIVRHLGSKLPIKEISDICCMSESLFKRKFRQETGYTPCDYINRKRIIRAREILSKDSDVLRAAMDTGFNSSDYFAVVFKKYTLQTPSEFIQSIHKARFQNKQTG